MIATTVVWLFETVTAPGVYLSLMETINNIVSSVGYTVSKLIRYNNDHFKVIALYRLIIWTVYHYYNNYCMKLKYFQKFFSCIKKPSFESDCDRDSF